MKIKEKFIGKVPVLLLNGNLMGGDSAIELQEKIKNLLTEGYKQIVIDLADVKWMNSTGLGSLMACLTTVRNSNGELKLSGVTDKIESLLNITKLITVFQTFESSERAAISFEIAKQ